MFGLNLRYAVISSRTFSKLYMCMLLKAISPNIAYDIYCQLNAKMWLISNDYKFQLYGLALKPEKRYEMIN